MRILKDNVILRILNSYLVDSPQPANLTYLWNFGSLLGLCLVLQILTGCFLAMHYTPNVDMAFNSVEHIMRDVQSGWIIRYTHANVASFFFTFLYIHVAKGLYYNSYKSPRVLLWSIGVIILILMMAIGFLGLLHSPKWFKFNFKKYKLNKFNINKFSLNSVNIHNTVSACLAVRQASHCFFLRHGIHNTFSDIKQSNFIGKRNFYTSSRKDLFLTLPCKNNCDEINKFITIKNINPVFIYDNLVDNNIKKNILKDTKNLSGIYLILNKFTLDYYIGSASTGKLYARFTNHLLNFNGSKVVKNAVKKYGLSSFSFMILELFPEIVNKENNKKLLDLEDFYLKSLLPNYNILTEAGSSFGYKHSEITRIKMKAIYSEERRMTIANLNKDKKLSHETIELMRQSALNRKKPIFSEESLTKMKKKSKAILVYNLDYTVYGEFSSITDASKSLSCDQKTIIRALNSPKKILRRRWIVKYV